MHNGRQIAAVIARYSSVQHTGCFSLTNLLVQSRIREKNKEMVTACNSGIQWRLERGIIGARSIDDCGRLVCH
jgi:hypothetical protein